jgi:hypothetical protein
VLVPTSTPTPSPVPTSTPMPSPMPIPSCTISTSPNTLNLISGGSGSVVNALITLNNSAVVSSVNFGSYNTSVATVSPTSDVSSPYSTVVTGLSTGTTAVWATAFLTTGQRCDTVATADTDVTVVMPIPTSTIDPVRACNTDCDCKCGLYNGQCAIGNVSYISGFCTIPNYCSGIDGHGGAACVNGSCTFKNPYTSTTCTKPTSYPR